MSRAQTERTHLCDALLRVGPEATTLCEGWTAHDLAAHVWLRENEPLAALGNVVPPLKDRSDARLEQFKQQLQNEELVDLIRQGPSRFSAFRLPGADEAANSLEFLIHGMDARRPNGVPEPARDTSYLDWAWNKLVKAAGLLMRGGSVAQVLEREGRPDQFVRVGRGNRIVTVIGRPDELMLYAFGRREAAEVRLVGLDDDIEALAA